MDKTNWFSEILRAAARPVISVICIAVFAQCVVEQITPPDWFVDIGRICILWWFTERAAGHVVSRIQVKKEVTAE